MPQRYQAFSIEFEELAMGRFIIHEAGQFGKDINLEFTIDPFLEHFLNLRNYLEKSFLACKVLQLPLHLPPFL